MPSLTEELAKEVIAAFRAELDEGVRAQISERQFEFLELLVKDAVAGGIHDAAERVEKLGRELRSEAGTPEIEL
ncbi:MAG: hypothetical protein U9Q81_19010 [Pseudomonadota bacterium]|nr:hypothetical protein [Pseudomonadota bacterium]